MSGKALFVFLLVCSLALGQTVTSSVKGTVVDASGAVVVGATCTLTNAATGQSSTATSFSDGSFTFANIPPGTYNLAVSASGFKAMTMSSVVVTANETRTVGRVALQVGEMKETVSVTAEAAALQLASAERSGLVTGTQLNDIAIKGRDFMAFLATIPGIVDTSAGGGREVMDPGAASAITINGNAGSQKNVTVDGSTILDTGNNTGLHYEPNMDAVAEVKVLSSNYQAEYGRMGGGTISIVTKSGTRDFHGTAYDYYRHESLNAKNFFDNRDKKPKTPYRYRISGYSIGGPIPLGGLNKNKDKLFFFFSQEFPGIKLDRGSRKTNMPTELERQGDFSQSYDVNGALIRIKDPKSGAYFDGNKIPAYMWNAKGLTVMKQFPMPNYTDPDPNARYSWNYMDYSTTPYEKRQEIAKIDVNVTSTIRGYYRMVNNKDRQVNYYGHWTLAATNFKLTPGVFDQPAKGHVFSVTKTFSPTFLSESMVAIDQNSVYINSTDPSTIDRKKWGDLPRWYSPQVNPNAFNPNYMPDIYFGGQPANTPVVLNNAINGIARWPWKNLNRNWTFMENLTKVTGTHQVKFGIFAEKVFKNDPTPAVIRGQYNFSRNTLNPFDSGNSFANLLLGNFYSYTESTARPTTDTHMWNVEWYAQDNWRVTQRFTLDYGLRFYHWTPCWDEGMRQSTFIPAMWSASKAPALYVPALNAQGQRVAKNPITGEFAAAPLIGMLVPNSGDLNNGIAIGGKTPGVVRGIENFPGLTLGPRFGFAYDVFGNGRTAIRGGFGMFFSRVTSGANMDMGGNPPAIYTSTAYYGNIDTLTQSAGALGPLTMRSMGGNIKLPTQMSFSLGIQQRIKSTVVEASYVGGLSRHLYGTKNWNAIPLGARFNPANMDPTKPGAWLPDDFLRPYKGFTDINLNQAQLSANYNALQLSANRRFTSGMQFGASYTFSKALGITGLSPYFDWRSWNYGPLSYDRTHVLVINYIYDIPKVGDRLGSKVFGWVLDNWQVSGITSFISGSPFTPGFTTTDGADITGSTESARSVVLGNPVLSKSEKTFYQAFNTSVFGRPAKGTFGNAGTNILRGPGVNNWDLAVTKRIPLFSEARFLQFRGEFFNTWNHTQFSGMNTTARFNAAGVQTDPLFGSYSSARDPRIIQFSLKLVF